MKPNTIDIILFVVSYINLLTKKVHSKTFESFEEAKEAYEFFLMPNHDHYSAKLAAKINNGEFTIMAHNWTKASYEAQDDANFRKEVRKELSKIPHITNPQIEAIMEMSSKDINNAVACRDIEKFCELNGVAEKTAKKVIFALKSLCKPIMEKSITSKDFVRVTLVNDPHSKNLYVVDTIHKTVSPLEAKAIELGGNDAVIHVVSRIMDTNENSEEDAVIREESLQDQWLKFVTNGIEINNVKYKLFGHGTNSAKMCKSIAVKESIYNDLRQWDSKGTNPNWKTTAAKKTAYLDGLHAVAHKKIPIPFIPEDVCIYPTVVTNVKANITKEFLDGHYENHNNADVPVKWSDGYFMISISDKKKAELHNRMVANGTSPEEAERILNAFINNTAGYSYRADGAAWKGFGEKRINAQKYLRSKGVTKTPDGRDIDDIIFFVDETVIKTTIGEDKAYPTFKAWCDAVREEFAIGTLVKEHRKEKKDVSYQVIQSLCEATSKTIKGMASDTIDYVNNLHTINGAQKTLGKEWGSVASIMPTLINVPSFKEQIEHKIENETNDAFSGKLIKQSYYGFVAPDGFFILDAWHGLEPKGCLEAGQIIHPVLNDGKKAMWRSPVMHPNSIRVLNNVTLPEEFTKYIHGWKHNIIMLNCKDDVPVAMDMDFDGDHANDSENEWLIKAAEETLKAWNRLIVWETPDTKKSAIGENEMTEYWKGLTHMNELGLTVYGLNALLNGILVEHPKYGDDEIIKVDVSHRGVNFKKFAANVLVDASKHGGATIEEPEESAQCAKMIQPMAKTYRDAVEKNQNWYVKYGKDKYYFLNESEANEFYKGIRYSTKPDGTVVDMLDCGLLGKTLTKPANYLDELANPDKLNRDLIWKTLNKLYEQYCDNIRRDKNIDDCPKEAFDYHKLMFNPEEGRRGLTGLVREGKMALVSIDGSMLRPDQGLFNSLSRRYDIERNKWQINDSTREETADSFDMAFRANALAEIEAFVTAFGKTLNDAYDVITWWMFEYCDKTYLRMDGKLDFIRNNMWNLYKVVFGGMAAEAASRYENC